MKSRRAAEQAESLPRRAGLFYGEAQPLAGSDLEEKSDSES